MKETMARKSKKDKTQNKKHGAEDGLASERAPSISDRSKSRTPVRIASDPEDGGSAALGNAQSGQATPGRRRLRPRPTPIRTSRTATSSAKTTRRSRWWVDFSGATREGDGRPP